MATAAEVEKRLNPIVISRTRSRFIAREMLAIGATPEGVKIMAARGRCYAVKLHRLSRLEANILKQELLNAGGDLAVHKDVVTERIESTDAVATFTYDQWHGVASILEQQPWSLPAISKVISQAIEYSDSSPTALQLSGRALALPNAPLVMGIINVTPDSFYAGSRKDSTADAIEAGMQMFRDGASIVDVGAESTRPGSGAVPEDEEIRRAIPVIAELASHGIVSVDTTKSRVAKEAIAAGASIVNDISAGTFDDEILNAVADRKCGFVLMHMKGTPMNMQDNPTYADVISEVMGHLRARVSAAVSARISRDSLIIDPGIGFGKLLEHNLQIVARLSDFRSLGIPVLVGLSRKSFIQKCGGGEKPEDRLDGTTAAHALCVAAGVSILRVHDVKEACSALNVAREIVRCTS